MKICENHLNHRSYAIVGGIIDGIYQNQTGVKTKLVKAV